MNPLMSETTRRVATHDVTNADLLSLSTDCFYYYYARSDMSGFMQTSFFFG